jgi:hypothetical protein
VRATSLELDLKAKSRALAVRLYREKGIPSHIIAQAFRENGIPISTKTVLKAVRLATNGSGVRGFDPFHGRQTYKWTKFLGKYRNWKLLGKITAPLQRIMQAFWKWFAYARLYGTFDLDAVLEGEKPP